MKREDRGTTDTSADVTDGDKTPEKAGYVFDATNGSNVLSGTIAGNGSLVLKVYFKLQFTVTYKPGTQGTFEDQKTENLDYGTETPAFEGTPSGNAGYTFAGWTPSVAGTVTRNADYVAQWTADEDTAYTVEYYYEEDGAYQETATSSVKRSGTTDTEASVTAEDKKPNSAGYVFDESAENILKGTIAGNGSLVLKVYFKQQFTVTYEPGTHGTFPSQKKENLDYGTATPGFEGETTGDAGYAFAGWKPEVAATVTKNAEYIAQWKGLEVTKDATSVVDSNGNTKPVTTALSLGDTVTYTITVTNIGTVDLSNIVVSDNKEVQLAQNSKWEIASLKAGETSAPIYVTYTIKESDLGKDLVNVATATVKEDPDVPVKPGEETNEVDKVNPSFEATKVITDKQQNATFGVGDTVSFEIIVENTGNVTLNNVTVGEELEGATIEEGTGYTVANNVATIKTLAPKAIVTVYAKYTVQQKDVDNADLVNTATVNAKDPDGKDLDTKKPSVEVPTDDKAPSMTAEKSIANKDEATGKDGKFKVGDTVKFHITVTNTGNVTLEGITVEEMENVVIDEVENGGYTVTNNIATIASLAPENSVVVHAYYVVTQEDIERGNLKNVATVTEPGKDEPKTPVVPVPTEDPTPAIAITKETTSTPADVVGYAEDETITYDIQATNTGNVTLHDVVITDKKTGDTWNVGTLAPKASTDVYKASYKVTQADILVGEVENTAVVVGTPARAEKEAEVAAQAFEEVVPDNPVTASATVKDPTVKPSSALKVTKTVTSKGSTITIDGKDVTGYRVGDTIEFNIHVENTGNITLNNIVVNDVPTLDAGSPKGSITIAASADGKYTVDGSTATIATLAPKASVDIKASYLVMAGDGTVKGNKLFNTAFATGTSEDPNNPQPGDSSKTDPVPIEPEPDDGNGAMEGSITVTKMITTSNGKTPKSGVNAAIKVGLYDNASFSGTPIAVNTITISNATSGNTVFNELDNTANTTYYVAELDANNQPIVAANAHLEGYGAPAYSDNCKNGINPTTATNTAATIINPLEALSAPEGGLEETEDTTEKTTEKSSATSDSSTSTKSSTAAKTGDDTNMMIYWLLLGMAVLAGCTAVVYRKRKER